MNAIERWLTAADAAADRQDLPDLKPLLRGMAASTAVLRGAAWNDRADAAVAMPVQKREEPRS